MQCCGALRRLGEETPAQAHSGSGCLFHKLMFYDGVLFCFTSWRHWMFDQLTDKGVEFWSNGVPDDDDWKSDHQAEPLFRQVKVTLACPLLELTDSQA